MSPSASSDDPTEPAVFPDPRGASGPLVQIERAATYALLDLELHEQARHVGRYVIRGVLGRGGMGVVARAYDPQLDREVALKLLDAAHGEVLTEARALAQLSHPNTVGVYEVGELSGTSYIAMELVEGTTLRQWLAEAREPVELLQMFLAIGEGLRAAHERGIVHRDFKPENVLVGQDGRPRVADFGLALSGGGEPGERPLAGTPAYLAPEQWLGQPADARSDQFAYCVALFEALYGVRPFEGSSVPELAEQVTQGQLREIRAGEQAPAGIHPAIVRGLATEPDARWPSLAELLDVIRDALGRILPGLARDGPGPLLWIMVPTAVTLPIVWLVLELLGVVPRSAEAWAYLTGLQMLMFGSVVFFARDTLRRTVRVPRLIVAPAVFLPLFLAHRVLALSTGTSIELMFAYDYLVFAAVGWTMSLLVQRVLVVVCLLGLSLAALAAWQPDWAPRLWAVLMIAIPAIATYAARKRA